MHCLVYGWSSSSRSSSWPSLWDLLVIIPLPSSASSTTLDSSLTAALVFRPFNGTEAVLTNEPLAVNGGGPWLCNWLDPVGYKEKVTYLLCLCVNEVTNNVLWVKGGWVDKPWLDAELMLSLLAAKASLCPSDVLEIRRALSDKMASTAFLSFAGTLASALSLW